MVNSTGPVEYDYVIPIQVNLLPRKPKYLKCHLTGEKDLFCQIFEHLGYHVEDKCRFPSDTQLVLHPFTAMQRQSVTMTSIGAALLTTTLLSPGEQVAAANVLLEPYRILLVDFRDYDDALDQLEEVPDPYSISNQE